MSLRSVAYAVSVCTLLSLVPGSSLAQNDSTSRRGRKYKAPPDTSHIEVLVVKKSNGKPIVNAAVVFHPIDKEGKDQGNMEVKTDPEGKAIIDVIPTGSNLRVQVIASGFATFAEDYLVSEPTRQISISMLRPQEQISAYQDNSGKASNRKPGVQEPIKPDTQAQPATPPKPLPPPPTNPTAPSTSSPNL